MLVKKLTTCICLQIEEKEVEKFKKLSLWWSEENNIKWKSFNFIFIKCII